MSAAMGIFPQGLKNEFDSAVVNEPSVFEPMKFYCTCTSCFSAIFKLGNNFCEFLFASLGKEAILKWGPSLKEMLKWEHSPS